MKPLITHLIQVAQVWCSPIQSSPTPGKLQKRNSIEDDWVRLAISHEEDVLNVQGHYAASKWEKNCRRHLGDHNFPPFDKYFILHHGIVL
ncbi:hypothetical protein Prudu_011277 [Prunus dulcis]|uniref:Uncharacterized protein n=1 Tax=Prunus dulcis TaxID=3755 RepID=A0A4Y1RA87_PRUDU|nr:hypothetical protein Prudu_011277 [Prunus dulcis]